MNYRKDKEVRMVFTEKDNTISRMKDEIRMYRVHIFKGSGWSEEEIDKHVK